MSIELTKEARAQAVASIERWFRENMDEPIGNIAAAGLLAFVLEEIGPTVYNQAVLDVQERLQLRVSELDLEVHEDEFQYWRKYDKAKGRKRNARVRRARPRPECPAPHRDCIAARNVLPGTRKP